MPKSHPNPPRRATPARDDTQPTAIAAGAGAASGLEANVLVLNRLYTAIRVISARRAFSLLCKGLAEVIHVEGIGHQRQYLNYDFQTWTELAELQREFEPERHDWVRTVRQYIAVPRVVRLLGYDRLPTQVVKLNRRNLFARDRNQCQYCGHSYPTSELSLDHVVPRTLGGGDSWENLVAACVRCNARKGGRTPRQASMKLVRPPARPARHPVVAIRLGSERYASWQAFLDDAYWSVELG